MLLFRSIPALSLYILVISITSTKCQYYGGSDYSSSDDGDEHSSYTGGEVNDKPDYSKYFSHDSPAPLLSATSGEIKETDQGFVSPLDFSGFFGGAHFEAESRTQQSNPVIPIHNPFLSEENKEASSSGFVDARDFQNGFSGAQLEFSPSNYEGTFNKDQFEPEAPTKAPVKEKINSYNPKKKYNKPKKYKSEVDDLNGNYDGKYNKKTLGTQNLDYLSSSYSPLSKSNLYNPIVPTLSSYKAASTITQLSPLKTYVPQYFPVKSNIQSTLAPYQSLTSASALLPTLESIKSTITPFNTNPTKSYYNPSTEFAQPSEYKSQKLDNFNYNPTSDYSQSSKEFAQPTEYKSQKLKNNNCQKVAKQLSPEDISHGRFRRQADKMNCYLCTDPKSGGKYEQCSYTSDPENDGSYFRGHAEKYSTRTFSNPDHFRKRRSASNSNRRSNKQKRDDEKEAEDDDYKYVNPFNYDKDSSHKLRSKPEEFDESSYYKSPDFGHYEKEDENYKFGPEYFTDSTNQEKSFSEQQSEELKKNGDNCKKIKKETMTCMVCSNPKTGGNYEQCSYTSEPNEKKYAYVKEKKYNSNDPVEEEKSEESTEPKPAVQRNKSRFVYNKPTARKIDHTHSFSASTRHPEQIKKDDDNDYQIPHHFISEAKKELKHRYDSDRISKPSESKRVTSTKSDGKEPEDYVYKLFPEYAEKESKNKEVKQKPGFDYHTDLPEYFTAEESQKDVDSVLQEFSKKDRSKCKKVAKDKMTCYLCTDDKGVQHEECMFVSESAPKSSHIAYHEVKEFTTDPKRNPSATNQKEIAADSSNQSNEKVLLPAASNASSKLKRKAVPKKPIALKEVDAEPTEYVKLSNYKSPRIVRRRTNISKDFLGLPDNSQSSKLVKRSENSRNNKKESDSDEEIREPEIENADGAYASELEPVYSKSLGLTLPAYMLAISEGEKIFDEAVRG